MKTLVTKSEHKLRPISLRHDISAKAYLNVSRTEFTKRGVRVIGQYYCLYEGGKHKLSVI